MCPRRIWRSSFIRVGYTTANANTRAPLWLHGLDAAHVALGALTTGGSKSSPTPCVRETDGEELSVGFALRGSTAGGVSTRLFAVVSRRANVKQSGSPTAHAAFAPSVLSQ